MKKRGRKRKITFYPSSDLTGQIEGKVIMLDDGREVIQISHEQALQLGFQSK